MYVWAAFEGKLPPTRQDLITLTGKSLLEALILASINPQYDKRLFIELQVQYMKINALKCNPCLQINF